MKQPLHAKHAQRQMGNTLMDDSAWNAWRIAKFAQKKTFVRLATLQIICMMIIDVMLLAMRLMATILQRKDADCAHRGNAKFAAVMFAHNASQIMCSRLIKAA